MDSVVGLDGPRPELECDGQWGWAGRALDARLDGDGMAHGVVLDGLSTPGLMVMGWHGVVLDGAQRRGRREQGHVAVSVPSSLHLRI